MKTAEDILRRLVAVREQQGLPALLRALGDVEQEAEEFLQRQSNYVDLVARGLGADACESLIDEQVKQAGFPEGTKGMRPAATKPEPAGEELIRLLAQSCGSPHCPRGEPQPVESSGKLGDGATIRCRKCGEQTTIEFNSARIVTHNPYTGKPRDERDIASDPEGVLMVDPSKPLRAAPAEPAGDDSLRVALSGLLEFCAEHNANQGDPATDDPRVTAAIVATRVKPEPAGEGSS